MGLFLVHLLTFLVIYFVYLYRTKIPTFITKSAFCMKVDISLLLKNFQNPVLVRLYYIYLQIMCWWIIRIFSLIEAFTREKNGNSLFFYQRGGTPPPPSEVWYISIFFPFCFYRFKMIFRVWNTFCMIWDFIFCDLWRQYINKPKEPSEYWKRFWTV